MSEWSGRRFALALVAVLTVGVALRALPLLQSPLPFNPDGIIHSRNAQWAARTGRFPLSIMAVDSLGFGSVLAVVQLVTGERSLFIGQPLIAVVGTLPALVAAVVARRIGLRKGWSIGRARFAGVLACAFLAVEGLYLFRSMPVDEQTPGLFLLPLALVGVVRGVWTEDRRWLLATLPILAFLPLLHNLESVVVGVALLVLAAVAAVESDGRRTVVRAGAVCCGFWAYFVGVTVATAQFTPATIIQSARLTDAPGLFLAWIVVAAFGVAWFRRVGDRWQRAVLVVPFLVMFGLFAVNVFVPVFPGTSRTPRAMFFPTVVLLVPVLIACWGYPVLTRVRENQLVLTALFVGPLAIVGFSLSADLTPVYVITALRASWFLHLPLLVLVGAAVAAGFGGLPDSQSVVRAVSVGLLLVLVAVSIPVSFGGLATFSYQGVTTSGEFAASTFANERIPGNWASDDHLVRITRYYGANHSGMVAPVYSWIHDGAPPPACPMLAKGSWATVGAQLFPRPPASVERSRLAALDRVAHRVYDGGGTESIRGYVPETGKSGSSCRSPGSSFRSGFTGP